MTLAAVDRYDPDQMPMIGDCAVIVGGSISGLCAARVLSEGFENVTVIEKDTLPDKPVTREGAPQTSHPHALLEAGRATLEDFFPSFGEEVLAEGGLMIDAGSRMEYYDEGGFIADTQERLPTYTASRALFEYVVRQKVRKIENVTILDDCQFTGFLANHDSTAVTGVKFRDGEREEKEIETDLVVDATGRTSRTPKWLEDHGYEPPSVDEVNVDVTYSTIRVKRPTDDRRIFFVPPSPPRTRGGALIPVEGDRWEVILQGIHGDDAPTDSDGFIDFIETLPVDEPAEIVKSQTWVSDEIEYYPFPSSRWHRYGELNDFPEGLVVTGDAVASFNPIYGQGMSVAALDALLLHHSLKNQGLDGLAPRFFDQVESVVEDVWKIAVGADFSFPQTTGPKPFGVDMFNWYISRLIRKAHSDSVLSKAFSRVLRLEKNPATLLSPGIAWRVFTPLSGTDSILGSKSQEKPPQQEFNGTSS